MITSSALADFFLISTIIIGIIFLYFYWFYYYSKNDNVPFACKPIIPFGTIPTSISTKLENPGIYVREWYLSAKSSGHKIIKGYNYCTPYYILIDLQYIKNLAIDFDYFHDRGFYYNEKKDPLSANLFAFSGQKWTSLRSKLSPCYTPVKIKNMFDTLLQSGYQLEEALQNKQVINLNEFATSYTVNVIGSYAFGIDCNSFKDPNMEFKQQGEEIFHIDFFRAVRIFLGFTYPNLALKLGVRIFSQKTTDFFIKIVKEVIDYRHENNVTRKDMIQLLMELNKKDETIGMDKTDFEAFDFREIAAELFLFFAAGFESSYITLTHCLYEISLNEEIQNKMRDEIHQVLEASDGEITYDALMDMKYMSQVIDETLRKHPPLMYVFKKTAKDYTFPGTDITLPGGKFVFYSIIGIHHDPEYYPEPEKFDPERFSTENKKSIPAYAYLPFGEGPRICIGARLGLIQVKVALTVLLKTYTVSLNEKTKLPLQYKRLSFTYAPSTQIYLNIEKVNKT